MEERERERERERKKVLTTGGGGAIIPGHGRKGQIRNGGKKEGEKERLWNVRTRTNSICSSRVLLERHRPHNNRRVRKAGLLRIWLDKERGRT